MDEKKRVKHFLSWLKKQSYRRVLIVSHKEILQMIIGEIKGLSDAQMFALRFWNAEVMTLKL